MASCIIIHSNLGVPLRHQQGTFELRYLANFLGRNFGKSSPSTAHWFFRCQEYVLAAPPSPIDTVNYTLQIIVLIESPDKNRSLLRRSQSQNVIWLIGHSKHFSYGVSSSFIYLYLSVMGVSGAVQCLNVTRLRAHNLKAPIHPSSGSYIDLDNYIIWVILLPSTCITAKKNPGD